MTTLDLAPAVRAEPAKLPDPTRDFEQGLENIRRHGLTIVPDVLTGDVLADTREQLGGYYLVEAKDLDTALDLAARIPGAMDGSIEVRPIMIYK